MKQRNPKTKKNQENILTKFKIKDMTHCRKDTPNNNLYKRFSTISFSLALVLSMSSSCFHVCFSLLVRLPLLFLFLLHVFQSLHFASIFFLVCCFVLLQTSSLRLFAFLPFWFAFSSSVCFLLSIVYSIFEAVSGFSNRASFLL